MSPGFTFLELLIALALFSLGLIGVLQLQFLAQRHLQEGIHGSVALQEAQQLCALFSMFQVSADSSLGLSFIHQWNEDLAKILPEGRGVVEGDAVFVFWRGVLEASAVCEDELICIRLSCGVWQ